jgi:hypothetical protein
MALFKKPMTVRGPLEKTHEILERRRRVKPHAGRSDLAQAPA